MNALKTATIIIFSLAVLIRLARISFEISTKAKKHPIIEEVCDIIANFRISF